MKTNTEVKSYLQGKFNSPGSLAKPETLLDILETFKNDPDIIMITAKDVNRMCDVIFFTVIEDGKHIVVHHIEMPWDIEKSQQLFDKYKLWEDKVKENG